MFETIESTLPRNAILGNVIEKSPNSKAALREQTDAFEAILLKQMLDIAMPAEDPLFGKSAGSEIYRSLYHESLASALSGGFGYSEALFNFLQSEVKEK
ncbi:MAG: rod-binding protein [Helicobacteraceae bacterium]|jgi:Rod binding domain-containing protein|nr:rod-binding protein [Helicobacteraceae bacterium]